MCVKFEGNPISCLHLMVVFYKCVKIEISDFFEGLYFKNGWQNLLQICYVFSPDMLAPAK